MKRILSMIIVICLFMQVNFFIFAENANTFINVRSLFDVNTEIETDKYEDIDDSIWFDSERVLPFNCGYEFYDETEFVRLNSINDQVSLSEDAYEGNFSLCLTPVCKNTNEYSLLPIKITDVLITNAKVSLFSLCSYPKVNKIDLMIKPTNGTEWISFYVYAEDTSDTSYKVMGDDNGDGVYVVGTDLSQGVWNKITLDLNDTEFENETGFINSLYACANDGSRWLIDNLSGKYVQTAEQNIPLSDISKDNLIVADNYLEFEKDSENNEEYNISPVITNIKVDLSEKLSGIKIDSIYGEQSESVQYNAIGENLFPEDIVENNNSELWILGSNAEFYKVSGAYKFRLLSSDGEPDDCTYIKIPENSNNTKRKKLILKTEGFGTNYVRIRNQDEFNIKLYGNKIHELILPPNTGEIYFSSSNYGYITCLKIFDIENSDTSISSTFINSPLIEHNKYTDLKYTDINDENMYFTGIDNYENITGTNEPISYKSSESEYIVVKVVCPYKINTGVEISNGNEAQIVKFGENEYLFSGYAIKQLRLKSNDNYPGILITGVKKYAHYNDIKINETQSSYLHDNDTAMFSKDGNKIYYISNDVINSLCVYTIDKNELKTFNDRYLVSEIISVSPNGKYAIYKNTNEETMIYSYDENFSSRADIENAFHINNDGFYCGIYKNDSDDNEYITSSDAVLSCSVQDEFDIEKVYINNEGTFVVCVKDSNSYIYKKQNSIWSYVGEISSNFKNIVFKNDFAYANLYKDVYIIDLNNVTHRKLQITGTLCSVTDDGKILINTSNNMIVWDADTQEKQIIASCSSEVAVYNTQTKRLLYIPNDETVVQSYSTLTTDRFVLSLLSFDGGKLWYTYKNNSWVYLPNTVKPEFSDFTEYGMTSREISNIPVEAFEELYDKFGEIYSLKISVLVHSRTEKYSPKIKSVSVVTDSDFDDSLYAAKSSYFNKSEYNKINAIYPVENITEGSENYYIIALGEKWLYTYKNGKAIRLDYSASRLFSDVANNWVYIKQSGMSSNELSSIPSETLCNLLLNDKVKNRGFYIINCVKTKGNTTKDITVSYKLSAEPKYTFKDQSNLTITFTDGSVKTLGVLDETTIQEFFVWFENCQVGKGKAYYRFDTPGGTIFVNYQNIQFIEMS